MVSQLLHPKAAAIRRVPRAPRRVVEEALIHLASPSGTMYVGMRCAAR